MFKRSLIAALGLLAAAGFAGAQERGGVAPIISGPTAKICFESKPNAGSDVCIQRTAAGVLQVTNGISSTGGLLGIASSTVAGLPAASSVPAGTLQAVTDALTQGSCTAGGGTQLGLCRSNGSTTWSPIGDGGGANAAAVVQSGLMAEYRILATETAAGLLDYSGNARNATGTVGTAPTILANTGGLNCTGNGAVILPAALNSALTIQVLVGYDPASNANVQNSPVGGNGNGATANAIQLVLTSLSNDAWSNTGPFQSGARLRTFSPGNTFKVASISAFAGTGVLTFTMGQPGGGDANDHLFINSQEVFYAQSAFASAGLQTAGAYQLGGAAAGSGQATQTYLTGQVYYAVFYSRVLNPAEIAANSQYMQSVMASRNIPMSVTAPLNALTAASASHTNLLLATGDSLTAGNGFNGYPTQLILNGTWSIDNNALPGTGSGTYLAGQPYTDQPLQHKSANQNVEIVWLGTNDTTNATNTTGELQGYCQNARAYGFKCIVATMIDRTGQTAGKNALDTAIRGNWNTWADGLADIAADPNLGADGANASATYFQGDHIHLTQFASTNNVVPIVQRDINRRYGNTNFSTAPTYVAAAAAAAATTAGSASGTTATITFAATPANCLVGNTITVASTTPAGYSGSFQILTRSATQVTYLLSATLGVITVQGTGVCPQQQDADQYQILNFGAGNYTLETCVGYTGQNIYIRNINAAATTLVPFGSETITGAGATPTTLAANTTAILQSQLVSSAAGGCNWARIQ